MLIGVAARLTVRTWLDDAVASMDRVEQAQSGRDYDCLVVTNESARGSDVSAQLVIHVFEPGEDPLAGQPSLSNDVPSLWVPFIPNHPEPLCAALEVARSRAHLESLQAIVSSPLTHDFRGVVSIIHLAAQVLERSDAPGAVSAKVKSAGTRLESLIEDAHFVARAHSCSPQESPGKVSMRAAWTDASAWFSVTHRGRSAEIDADDLSASVPADAAFLLRGLLDAVARLTPTTAGLRVTAGAGTFQVAAPLDEASEELALLLETSPRKWPRTGRAGAAFRFLSALLTVERRGGSASLRHEQGSLVASLAWA